MRIVLSPDALADLARLRIWLADKNPSAATRAITTIRKTIRSLDQFPERGYNVGSGVRQLRAPFGKRGYVIRYEVLEDTVQIARIFHALEER